MAYHYDAYDSSLVIDGFGNGIADSPFDGISDMRNVNITSVPGEASVNFATSKISPTAITTAGSVSSADAGTKIVTFSGATGIDDGRTIVFSVQSGLGVVVGTRYWVDILSPTTMQLYTTPARTVIVNVTNGTGTFTVYNMATPKHFVWTGLYNYMVDAIGQVWYDAFLTGSGFWTFTGNKDPDGYGNANGNGLVFLQQGGSGFSVGSGFVFVFRNSAIDYISAGTGVTWVYGWDPHTGTTGNSDGYLNSLTEELNSHEAFVAPTNQVIYCDDNYIGRFYQKNPATSFNPTNSATFIFDETALLPGGDVSNCLTYLGTNILVGGSRNVIYVWNGFSTTYSYTILLAENYVTKMVTVNTTSYLFIGNRGRIYYTDGTNAQLFKKVPDHISGTVEPYFQWGGATFTKNQLYFGVFCRTNAGVEIPQYGGLWAIDIDTKGLRLVNELSYNAYNGYVSSIIPNFTMNPGGSGLYIGWGYSPQHQVNNLTSSNVSTTITSTVPTFSSADVGLTFYDVNGFISPGTTIISVTNSMSATMSAVAAVSTSNFSTILLDLANNGVDTSVVSPYTGGQSTVDSDLIPIGTYQKPMDMTTIEYRLTRPLVAGESIAIKTRLIFDTTSTGYTTIPNITTGVGAYSGRGDVNFKNAQWLQFQCVLTSTATSPSYVRLKEIRILGLVGLDTTAAQQPVL